MMQGWGTEFRPFSVFPDGTIVSPTTPRHAYVPLAHLRPVAPPTPISEQADVLLATGMISHGIRLPDVVEGLRARYAALEGKDTEVTSFATKVLGLGRGPQWGEAVSTALLGDWATPLFAGGRIGPTALTTLRAEAQSIHRQLAPLWRRKPNGSRVISLDTQLGDGLTLYDTVADRSATPDLARDWLPDDARLAAILKALDPLEQRVVIARAHPAVATWEEAALLVGDPHPAALGDRVRRKLKRLRDRHAARASAAAATWNGSR